MKKSLAVFVLSILAACSTSDEERNPQNPDPDGKSLFPTLSVQNVIDQSTVETYTDIEVTVSDDSEVRTTVYVNDEQVYETTDTQFVYNFNPYVIPVGSATIRIESTDADNNMVEQTFEVELKHLLLTTDIADYQLGDDETVWDMIHSIDGALLSVEKLALGLNKLYTEEVVDEEEIYYSRVYYRNSASRLERVATVYTYPLGLGRHRSVLDRTREDLENSNRFTLTVDGLTESDFLVFYEARGTKYATSSFSSGFNATSFEASAETFFENNTDKLFYTNQSYLVAFENGGTGKKEDYKYFVLDDPQNETTVLVNEGDLGILENSFRVDLPQGMESYNIDRYGFETADDLALETYNNHRIFSHASSSIDYVDLPILGMFGYYRNYVNYHNPSTGYRNIFVTFGNEVQLEELNGEIAFEAMENSINISTTAVDTDALRMVYGGIIDDNGDNYWDSFNWYYRLDPKKGQQNQIVLSLPQSIKDEFQNGFLFEQELQLLNADVIDYEKIEDFEDFMFTFILEDRDDPLENGYRRKILFNNSGTSNKNLSVSKNTEPLHDLSIE